MLLFQVMIVDLRKVANLNLRDSDTISIKDDNLRYILA